VSLRVPSYLALSFGARCKLRLPAIACRWGGSVVADGKVFQPLEFFRTDAFDGQ
jgi:hypothetical protein